MKLAVTFSLVAAAGLAGCATERSPIAGVDNAVTHQLPYKTGSGVVTAWMPLPSAAAGASGRVDPTPGSDLRMAIRMDDGSTQYVDTDTRAFPVGTRVQLTQDRVIKRP